VQIRNLGRTSQLSARVIFHDTNVGNTTKKQYFPTLVSCVGNATLCDITKVIKFKGEDKMPKTFISYAWENETHINWVRSFAEKLRNDGVEVILDQWHLTPGEQLPEFMERSIRENDFVLIICTPSYKLKSDKRTGGVGYEGDIITSEVFTQGNQKKFIPILRDGKWDEAAPSWLLGKYYIDLKDSGYFESKYNDLLATLHNLRPQAPPVGRVPVERIRYQSLSQSQTANPANIEIAPTKIEGIIVDEVTSPKMDGTRGSALYKIPFKLSRRPSHVWQEVFIQTWKSPPRFTSMHRPGIASISGDRIILNGTTIEEVEKYHRDTLKLCVERANEIEKEIENQKKKQEDMERARREAHEEEVREGASRIKFD
jgi:hypothetical protein